MTPYTVPALTWNFWTPQFGSDSTPGIEPVFRSLLQPPRAAGAVESLTVEALRNHRRRSPGQTLPDPEVYTPHESSSYPAHSDGKHMDRAQGSL